MVVPFFLFVLSGLAVVAVLILPGLSDFLMIAGPCAIASLILLIRSLERSARAKDPDAAVPVVRPRRVAPVFRPATKGREAPRWILIDGSNVMYWKDGTPQIETVRFVVTHLVERGYTPGVVFDANAGYLVAGKYQHHHAMGALLGLPEDRVMVVAKGTPADPVLLAAARDYSARIVTNDRFRDWAESHPEVGTPGHLVRGGFGDTGLWLDVDGGAGMNPAPPGISSART